jgi:hypothetical protein
MTMIRRVVVSILFSHYRTVAVPVQCQKSASSMMMGIGTPKSQSRMPLPMIFLLMWFGA